MGLMNCPACGKLMMENPRGLCPECYAKEEEDELRVAEFLREHRNSSVEQIHEATGVAYKTIMRMIRENRITSDVEVMYPCESCGILIKEGRLCANCSRSLQEQVSRMQDKREANSREETWKMNYVRKDDRRR